MRKAIWGALAALVVLVAIACDEPKKTYVEGEFEMSTNTSTFTFEGSLGKGGADYYGYCSYSDDKFLFEVGTGSIGSVDTTGEMYVKITGVQGPPIEGVYEDPADYESMKDDQEIAFGYVTVKSGANTFGFPQPDDADSCYFEMFAEPVSGELTPIRKKKFDYYVSINCNGLDDVTDGDTPLNSVNGYFFFKGCD